ncbi:MAG: aldehyde dehydrogenase family protein [Nitrososphaerota archaeon]|nr:aldehyde dehydrogenase family protein [Candidatus Calditenuaceae archaeon]MDW8072644.1 aldehyde dehydrogenase family protein [Nitrososphaerota archaeon]
MAPELGRLEGPRLRLSGFFEDLYSLNEEGLPVFKMFINGRWVEGQTGQVFPVDTPIDDSIVAFAQKGGDSDVDKAVEAARDARPSIRSIAAIDRIEIFHETARIIERHLEDFVSVLMLEAGKPRADAAGEITAVMERMEMTMEDVSKVSGEYKPGDWSADSLGKVAIVLREPVGTVGAIGPFNYPLYIPAAKIIPAILSGNTVVVKPASETPLSQLLLAKALDEAGVPPGVLNVVTGPGRVGARIAAHEEVGMVSFTGSTEVGREIARIAASKRLHLELGGKAYAIVLDDADLDLAANRCVAGSLRNAGQRCDAVSAILVVESVAEEFVRRVLAEVDKVKLGDPRVEGVNMGPLINRAAAERVNLLVKDAVAKGAKLLRGGNFKGCYHEPTVLDKVPMDARILFEETFGPVVTIARVKDDTEAIAIASKSRYGLDSCVFSNNFYRIWKVVKALQYGSITVNDFPRHGVGYFPFGGVKESGIGREGIGYSIEEMMVLKTVVFNLEPAQLGKVRRPKRRQH